MRWAGQLFARCDAIHAADGQVVLGTADHLMHTLLANTEIFGKTGGHLSRLVYELLQPQSRVRRLETLMYTEAGLLGPLRAQDTKLLVASFPSVFGTPDAAVVRKFSADHGVPLAWALSDGESWADEQVQISNAREWMPFSPDTVTVGHARMLDPASWRFTNATAPTIATKVWGAIEAEVIKFRNMSNQKITAQQFIGWWSALDIAGGSVSHLRAGDCASADLCFGTYRLPKGVRNEKDCVCRLPPSRKISPEAVLV
jgi:hypothetical protein